MHAAKMKKRSGVFKWTNAKGTPVTKGTICWLNETGHSRCCIKSRILLEEVDTSLESIGNSF